MIYSWINIQIYKNYIKYLYTKYQFSYVPSFRDKHCIEHKNFTSSGLGDIRTQPVKSISCIGYNALFYCLNTMTSLPST